MIDERERDLALGLRQGKTDAWRTFYDAYAERVWWSVARALGPASPDVADVVQGTFLAAAQSVRTYNPRRGTLWFWLWGITRRYVALHLRKQKRQDQLMQAAQWLATGNGQALRCLEGNEAAPPELAEAAELATLIRATLVELPFDYEMLLTARYLEGRSVAQLAAQEESTVPAIRSKLARARQAFRQAFGKHAAPFAAESGKRKR
jgi:RNA polymerase sigma-70 factor (ECF subfamily)